MNNEKNIEFKKKAKYGTVILSISRIVSNNLSFERKIRDRR